MQGKYVVLFFYPLDFTFVCPTEITAFSDRHGEFEKINTEARTQDWRELCSEATVSNRLQLGHKVPVHAASQFAPVQALA